MCGSDPRVVEVQRIVAQDRLPVCGGERLLLRAVGVGAVLLQELVRHAADVGVVDEVRRASATGRLHSVAGSVLVPSGRLAAKSGLVQSRFVRPW